MATLYAIRSAPGVPAQDDDEVVDEMDHGYACLEAAITLWRLVDPARAESLRSFLVRVADASEDHTQFAGDDLAALIQMLSGSGRPSRPPEFSINIGGLLRNVWTN